ncbi:MAG: DNA mismatch endonuclease Vsr [Deltaproteobacteria bacterium]|nr:DNA mismatch endonuclease Vsr [Deltaproteobacteria bacterium]
MCSVTTYQYVRILSQNDTKGAPVDVHPSKIRSKNMSCIRRKGTQAELKCAALFMKIGLSFQEQLSEMKGNPDFFLPAYKTVVFVHGCFWHGHSAGCFRWPSSRRDFWYGKITNNQERDAQIRSFYQNHADWRMVVVWECSLRGKFSLDESYLTVVLWDWLRSSSDFLEIAPVSSFSWPETEGEQESYNGWLT